MILMFSKGFKIFVLLQKDTLTGTGGSFEGPLALQFVRDSSHLVIQFSVELECSPRPGMLMQHLI